MRHLLEQVDPGVRELCERLGRAGRRAWIVGGCVRDLLLGRTPGGDWDVATEARPSEVMDVFRRGAKVIPTGIQHGTVTVLLRGHDQPYEVTTLRGEGPYTDGRRPDAVTFVSSIEEDLARRDFTVNAMAIDPASGVLIDPFGGQADLALRLLRAVGDPLARFGEDGLRPLRACRFAATLEFDLDPETAAAIPRTIDTFRKVSQERVQAEWKKALGAARPSRAFRTMLATGLLAETSPDLARGAGCVQNRFHGHDVFDHTMAALDAAALAGGSPLVRLSVLLHDIGKPAARVWSEEKKDWTFFHHEHVGADLADGLLRRLRFANDERDKAVHLVRQHLVFYEDDWSDAAVRRLARRVGPEAVADLLAVMRADARGRGIPEGTADDLARIDRLEERFTTLVAEGTALTTASLAIDGKDVMTALGVGPSPIVGKVLRALLERVLDDPSLNERERLLALVAGVAAAVA
jgi:tRNA nucleotidyltransferase (CCA-adding enzyme)